MVNQIIVLTGSVAQFSKASYVSQDPNVGAYSYGWHGSHVRATALGMALLADLDTGARSQRDDWCQLISQLWDARRVLEVESLRPN